MKCSECGAWTMVKETREIDGGYGLRRTRECANGHRFPSFEVLSPVYRRSPVAVRQTRVAAGVRAFMWRRDCEITARSAKESHAAIAKSIGLSRQAISKAIARIKRAQAATKKRLRID